MFQMLLVAKGHCSGSLEALPVDVVVAASVVVVEAVVSVEVVVDTVGVPVVGAT
jgi:hypothetical protein